MGINTGEVQERDGDYFGPPVNRTRPAHGRRSRRAGAALGGDRGAGPGPGAAQPRRAPPARPRLARCSSAARHRRVPAAADARRAAGQPAGAAHELHRPGRRGEGARRAGRCRAVGDAHRAGRGRQVAPRVAGRGRGRARVPRRRVVRVARRARRGARWSAATILEALGVPERQGEPAIDTLCAWASAREALVVIDNCEHLLGRRRRRSSTDLMDASATVTVLATSQAPLGVRGEHVWAVAPLSGRSGVSRDSVELFVDRARMARADFALTTENEAAVAEICERLDHVPLAIELAAARVRGMTPADIARRLDQRLRLLASSDRLAPGRHRTLDAAVRWSYELLDETQRRVFDRCSRVRGAVHDRGRGSGGRRRRRRRVGGARRDPRAGRQVARRRRRGGRRNALPAVGDDAPVRPGEPRGRRG